MHVVDPDEDDPRFREAIDALGRGRFEEAFALVQAMADEGLPLAIHFLGWLHHKGLGTPPDDRLAVRCWQEAARSGIAGSMQGLGWAYETGRGVEADPIRAYAWYQCAVRHGDDSAREFLLELAPRLTPEQILEAESLTMCDDRT